MPATHTPAPWRVGPVDDCRVEDALGNEVAQIDGDYNQPETWPVMEANARLIAASPDMLDALIEADDFLGCMGIPEDAEPRIQIRAAIAKATAQPEGGV